MTLYAHVIPENFTGIIDESKGVRLWESSYLYVPGIYLRGNDIICVLTKYPGRPVIAVDTDFKTFSGTKVFYQKDNDWHRNPVTGKPIKYRFLHPVEYVFD